VGEEQTISHYRSWRKTWHNVERALTFGRWPAKLAVGLGAPVGVAIEHHEVEVASALGDAETLRIAFAADFHAGPSTADALIENAITQLKSLSADVLLLGGDFVSLNDDGMPDLAARLAAVPAPFGRYAVLGNHDHWTDAEAVAASLQDAGIEMLTNRNVRLPDPFGHVSICGLDDHTSGEPDAEGAFRGSAPVRIVLMHAPSNLLDIGDRPFDVAMCGHTHGGQIALPNGRPIKVAHGPLSRTFNAGRFAVGGNRVLLVSRGVGCSTVPLRLNAPAAVMSCTLTGRRAR